MNLKEWVLYSNIFKNPESSKTLKHILSEDCQGLGMTSIFRKTPIQIPYMLYGVGKNLNLKTDKNQKQSDNYQKGGYHGT